MNEATFTQKEEVACLKVNAQKIYTTNFLTLLNWTLRIDTLSLPSYWGQNAENKTEIACQIARSPEINTLQEKS